jgi:hypothetical protein
MTTPLSSAFLFTRDFGWWLPVTTGHVPLLMRGAFAGSGQRALAFEILGTDVVQEVLEVIDDFGGIDFRLGRCLLGFGCH